MMLDLPYSHAGSGLSVVDWVPHGTGGALTLAGVQTWSGWREAFPNAMCLGKRPRTKKNAVGPLLLLSTLGMTMIFSDVLWTTFDHTDTLHWKLHPSKAWTVTTNPKCLNELLVFHITHNVQQLTEQDLYIHTKSCKKSCWVSIHSNNCAVHNTMQRPRINHLEAQKYRLTSLHSKWRISSQRSLGSSASRFQVGDRHKSKTCGVNKNVCLKNAKRTCESVCSQHITFDFKKTCWVHKSWSECVETKTLLQHGFLLSPLVPSEKVWLTRLENWAANICKSLNSVWHMQKTWDYTEILISYISWNQPENSPLRPFPTGLTFLEIRACLRVRWTISTMALHHLIMRLTKNTLS